MKISELINFKVKLKKKYTFGGQQLVIRKEYGFAQNVAQYRRPRHLLKPKNQETVTAFKSCAGLFSEPERTDALVLISRSC